jgi:hypothetical protein
VLSKNQSTVDFLISNAVSLSTYERPKLVEFKANLHIVGPTVEIADEELNTLPGLLKFNLIKNGSNMERRVVDFLDCIGGEFNILKEGITAADKLQLLLLVKGFNALSLVLADGAITPEKRLKHLEDYVKILAGAVKFTSQLAPQYDQSHATPQYPLD